jgi:uncharacterized membrane protein
VPLAAALSTGSSACLRVGVSSGPVPLRRVVPALLLLAAAVSLAKTLVTRDHVGVFEYLVGALVVALLLQWAFRISRHAASRS